MGTEDDYDKAKQFLAENKLTSVGTLSKSEWEVACKYPSDINTLKVKTSF